MQRVPLSKSQLTQIMKKYKGHLIASTACLGGELPQQLLKLRKLRAKEDIMREAQKKQEIIDFILYCQETFGKDNFFFEVQPNKSDEQVYVNQMIRVLAEQTNIKIVYTTDSHYLSSEERTVHKAFLNAMDGEREVDDFYSTAYMMDKEEVYSFGLRIRENLNNGLTTQIMFVTKLKYMMFINLKKFLKLKWRTLKKTSNCIRSTL